MRPQTPERPRRSPGGPWPCPRSTAAGASSSSRWSWGSSWRPRPRARASPSPRSPASSRGTRCGSGSSTAASASATRARRWPSASSPATPCSRWPWLAAAFALAPAPFWPPLAVAAPIGLVALAFDARRAQPRGPARGGGGGRARAPRPRRSRSPGAPRRRLAWGAWALLALRAVTSVLYVRARIRLDRGLAAGPRAVLAGHAAALAAATGLASAGWAPWLAPAVFFVLLARAGVGTVVLAPPRPAAGARLPGARLRDR